MVTYLGKTEQVCHTTPAEQSSQTQHGLPPREDGTCLPDHAVSRPENVFCMIDRRRPLPLTGDSDRPAIET